MPKAILTLKTLSNLDNTLYRLKKYENRWKDISELMHLVFGWKPSFCTELFFFIYNFLRNLFAMNIMRQENTISLWLCWLR